MAADAGERGQGGGEHLFGVLWKRRVTLLITFLATLAAAAVVTFSLPKAYSTVAYVWVSASETPESDFEATQLSQVLTRTYAELLQTRNVAEAVETRLPFDTSPAALQGAVEVSSPSQSQLLAIEATGSSPERAQQIADTYATVFVERARAFGARGATTSRVALAEPAPLVEEPSRPRPLLYLLAGAFVAAIAAVGAAVARERLDQRIRVDGSSTELLGLPILGRIPSAPGTASTALVRESASTAERRTDEAFRLLVANLWFVSLGRRPSTLAVVSANESEGKSTSCVNVARAAAGIGADVLLIDGDLRRPSLSAQLAGDHRPGAGLSNLLLGAGSLEESAKRIFPTVHFVPAGPLPPNPMALLAPKHLEVFNRTALERHDFVIYDTPPLSVGVDASLIAGEAEGTILVVDAGRTRRDELVQAVAQLERSQARILGVVLNRVRQAPSSYYYDDADATGSRARAGNGRAEPPSSPLLPSERE